MNLRTLSTAIALLIGLTSISYADSKTELNDIQAKEFNLYDLKSESIGINKSSNHLSNAPADHVQRTEWFDFSNVHSFFWFGQNRGNIVNLMFPDTNVVRISDEGDLSWVGTASVGIGFDPSDESFRDPDVGLYVDTEEEYTVNSINFSYRYGRYIDEYTTYDTTWSENTAYNFEVDGLMPDSLKYRENTTHRYVYNEQEDKYDTIPLDSWEVTFYDYTNEEAPHDELETITVWPSYYILDSDSSGEATDTTILEADSTVYLDSRTYQVVDHVDQEVKDVVDSIVVQIFRDNIDYRRYWFISGDSPDTFNVATVAFNRTLGMPSVNAAYETHTIYLTEDDANLDINALFSEGAYRLKEGASPSKEIQLNEPMTVGPGGRPVVTITYFPGKPYSHGDTVLDLTQSTPSGSQNLFYSVYVIDNSVTSVQDFVPIQSFNTSIWVPKTHRYSPNSPGFLDNLMLPMHDYRLMDINFNVSYTEIHVGIDEKGHTLGLNNAYPNPVEQGESFNVEFYTAKFGDVEISLYDMVGKKVSSITKQSLPAGEHSVELSTSELNPGIYLYKVNTNGEEQARRISVIK